MSSAQLASTWGDTMRYKSHPEANYLAVFNHGFTIRIAIDPAKPLLPLKYPELEDVSLGTLCDGGCPYCYAASSDRGEVYTDALQHVYEHYGQLQMNDRPFQVAIGGGGEPTQHPDFPAILQAFKELGIMPNATTNGLNLTRSVLEAIDKYAGGVAVSCHAHLPWRVAYFTLREVTPTSLHIIVGEPGSAARFWSIVDLYSDGVDNYVALPYQAIGRARDVLPKYEWDVFFAEAMRRKPDNIAFGAGFYDYFTANMHVPEALGIELYEPDVLSGYRRLDDTYRVLRRSSYDPQPKFEEAKQCASVN